MYRICLLIIGVLFVACSDKNNRSDTQPQGLKIRVGFAIADQIGIFATRGAIANNVKYVVPEGQVQPVAATHTNQNINIKL